MNFYRILALLMIVLVLTVSAQKCDKTKCNNKRPPQPKGTPKQTCAMRKSFGQCEEDFMAGYCECTCKTCSIFQETAEEVETPTME